MSYYRLINPANEEIVFGVDNVDDNAVLKKLNRGVATVRPYNHVVPYFKKAKFAFMDFNAFKYFLFYICKFSYHDLLELENLGYKVIEQDLESYSNGLSRLFCTYFDDEVVELKEVLLSSLFKSADSCTWHPIYMPNTAKNLVSECKRMHYVDVKFKS